MADKRVYQVVLNGRVWSNYLTADHAAQQSIKARQEGRGMAYVEKMEFGTRRKSNNLAEKIDNSLANFARPDCQTLDIY